ncbi:MAG TPA: exonuclease domain-containing protein [Casimicrobiaceae bacterium]|nr:exonuclease domain-containing protein [Casimicrobiaceae bacterium]
MLPAPAFAFIDLETTGTSAQRDRITEIGIVRVDEDGTAGPRVTEWSSLVDPEVPIPAAIQALTGITNSMVACAPTFSALARDVLQMLAGCVFVAHNARFDYGFLKHAFARLEKAFAARVLCTVRLSRRLFPEEPAHGLDAVISRHALHVPDRHRALGDARALWSFVQCLYAQIDRERVDTAIKRILRIPSLPPQLPPDTIDALPEAPGVYLFYGDNPLPLYIGKSINLRERVSAHFSADWHSETDLRLSREIRRIEHQRTAGELGALIREAVLIKSKMPAHNRALRRKTEAGIVHLVDGLPRFTCAAGADATVLSGAYGPFASRAAFRATLRQLAAEHRLCWRRLALERRAHGACFARQLHRCDGVCVGEEAPEIHDRRLADALAPFRITPWPFAGPALVRESASAEEGADVHIVFEWCWLGTARDDGELAMLLEAPQRASFDPDVTRLFLRRYRAGTLRLLPIAVAARENGASID